MDTVYDWVTLVIFAGLIVTFLDRSVKETPDASDSLLMYLLAGVGCAVTNYLGNKGYDALAIALLLGTIGFILYFIRPFGFHRT